MKILGGVLSLTCLCLFMLWTSWGIAAEEAGLIWDPNAYLLLDDYYIAQSQGLVRKINMPEKLPDPIITGRKQDGTGDNCFQPYLTVIRDPETGRFRMWYGVPEDSGQSHLAYIESEDGIHWIPPHRVLDDPMKIQFGCAVIDRGASFPTPEERYAYGFYGDGGLRIAVSPDGFKWRMTEAFVKHNHDITWLGWDPLRAQYLAFLSMTLPGEGWAENRRIPHMTTSPSLLAWKTPWRVVKPEPGESGETQFYCMAGAIARGHTLVALVKVLRDDLNPEPDKTAAGMGDLDRKAAGLGYTVLAWSHDGETWQRDVEPFIDRNPVPGTWDRAMAWGDCQVPVGDQVFLYYGGYKRGHKVKRFEERQIGLARIMRDRYTAQAAGRDEGTLRTKPGILKAKTLTVNSKGYGTLKARLLDAVGNPIEGFGWDDMEPVMGDSVAHPVKWKGDLAALQGQSVAIEFTLNNTELYSFDWLD